MNERICGFTGHRIIKGEIKTRLENEISSLCEKGYNTFLSGGALGFDTAAAQTVLNLKEKYDIKLILILPCKNQDLKWKEYDKEVYKNLKAQADDIIYTSDNYYNGCMLRRNDYIIDKSKIIISYQYKNTGGTAYTVRKAKEKGIEVINIYSDRQTLSNI